MELVSTIHTMSCTIFLRAKYNHSSVGLRDGNAGDNGPGRNKSRSHIERPRSCSLSLCRYLDLEFDHYLRGSGQSTHNAFT